MNEPLMLMRWDWGMHPFWQPTVSISGLDKGDLQETGTPPFVIRPHWVSLSRNSAWDPGRQRSRRAWPGVKEELRENTGGGVTKAEFESCFPYIWGVSPRSRQKTPSTSEECMSHHLQQDRSLLGTIETMFTAIFSRWPKTHCQQHYDSALNIILSR